MRRVSRSGHSYTQGSHTTRGDYPRECAACGEPTKLNECWQESVDGVKRSYHHRCRLRVGGVK